MSHSKLLNFTFRYNTNCKIPLIPVRFLDSNDKSTPTFNALLDSGADEVTIPKKLANILNYNNLIKRNKPIYTAGGEKEAYSTKANFNVGRGGRITKYTDIGICVIDVDMPILMGITPIFEDYKVTIMAYDKKILLETK